MRKFLLIVLTLSLSFSTSFAQQENTWAFGTKAAINFNSGTPVFETSKMVADEACASVCGANGRLLFYTDGTFVWDSLGNIMTNGGDLTGTLGQTAPFTDTWSTAQGALIVPMPDSASKYYIFSLTAETGKLYYSIVNMTLSNGRGDVEGNRKAVLVDSGLSEMMTAVVGNNCNIWLLTSTRTPKFKAFEITSAGISSNPVLSTVGVGGGLGLDHMGCMGVSPDRTKIAATSCFPLTDNVSAALFDFDANTGIVTNRLPLILDTASDAALAYSVCFSPDNSKLYINSLSTGNISQFDLSAGSNAQILNSRTNVGTTGFSNMKMGPDNKIYFLTNTPGSQPNEVLTNQALGRINAPDLAGTSCQYNPLVITFPVQTEEFFGWAYGTGLPNVVPPAIVSVSPVITANGTQLSTASTYTSYQWYLDGVAIPGATSSTYTATENGDYTVTVTGDHGCTGTSAVYEVTNVTGIGQPGTVASQIKIYPNPASDMIQISSPEYIDVTLYTLEGRAINHIKNARQISVQQLAEGVYWLRIMNKDGHLIKTEKIAKMK